MTKSIIQEDLTRCKICGTKNNIHIHHVFYGSANRKKSDEDGLVIAVCGPHHNMSSAGVHFNHELDVALKKEAEKFWIKTYCDETQSKKSKISDFIARYRINYLEEEDL